MTLVIGVIPLQPISRDGLSSWLLVWSNALVLENLLDSWLSDYTWGVDGLRNVLSVVVHNRSWDVLKDFFVLLLGFSQVEVSCLVELRLKISHGLV